MEEIQGYSNQINGCYKRTAEESAMINRIVEERNEALKKVKEKYHSEDEDIETEFDDDPNDAVSFLDENGNLPNQLSYVYTKEGQAQMEHDKFLLSNFYEYKPTDMLTGGGTYILNDFGKSLAGSDGVISKAELMKLDMNKDGKITQEDIDKYKAKIKEEQDETKDLTDSLLKSLGEDGFLADGGGRAVCPSGTENFEKAYGELIQFFEALPTYGMDGYQGYGLNEYGRALAGADGKITKEELMKLDMNGDGKITQEDIENYKKDINNKKASDLYTYIDCGGNLTNIRSYLSSDEVEHEQLLLSNLYEEIPAESLKGSNGSFTMLGDNTITGIVDGVEIDTAHKNYKLNALGKSLAGADGVISKEELMKLDMDGDGKITQDDIDKYKEKINTNNVENPTSLTTYVEKYGEIKSPLLYFESKEDKAKMEYDKFLLETLYIKYYNEPNGYTYEFTNFAKMIAGADGVISKEELMKLDMNNDGKITQDDIDKYKAKLKNEDDGEDLTSYFKNNLADGFLPTYISSSSLPAERTKFKQKYGELTQFFESLPNYGQYGIDKYQLNEYGRALAGADGKISEEEYKKLDMNGDGKITQNDIDKYKADLINKKASDLVTYLNGNESLPKVKSYLSDSEVEHENFLLSNLYEEITKESLMPKDGLVTMERDGTIVDTVDGVKIDTAHKNYKLNEFGKQIAGSDGVISKEELMKLDMNGDGKITQDDIDEYKAKMAE